MSHPFEKAVQVVEARPLHGFAAPALVHEVVELAATAWWGSGGHAGPSPSAAPFAGVGHHLVRQ